MSTMLDIFPSRDLKRSMETKTESCCSSQDAQKEKTGFFQRMWQKLDNKMKEKAEAQEGCGCGCGDDPDKKASPDKCC